MQYELNETNQILYIKYRNKWYKRFFDEPLKMANKNNVLYFNDKIIKFKDYIDWIPSSEFEVKSLYQKEFILWIEFLSKYKLIAHLNNGKKKFVDLQPLIDFHNEYKFIETEFYNLRPLYKYILYVPNKRTQDGDYYRTYDNYIKDLPYMEE